MKINRKLRKIFNLYNLAIVGCIIIIAVSLIIFFKPTKKVTPYGLEVIDTKIAKEDNITEENARKSAVKQFKKLGEKIKEEDLKITKIQRKGEEYYYITSSENTLEIKIKGGEITRINSATVNE